MFCAPGLIFGGSEGAESRFHVLRSRTHFSCFALPHTFFMFCAFGLVFGGNEGVRSRFLVLCSRIHFRRFRVGQVPFSCFARRELPRASGPFSELPRASGPFFMFCTPGLIFGGTEGVGFLFHVLLSRTRFGRYRVRRVPFSCFARSYSFSRLPSRRVPFSFFALLDSFSAGLSASGPVFMFCAPELVFSSTVGVSCRFHVLRSRTHFRLY
jgi:hypothetical protein